MKTNIVETMKNGTTANINSTIEKTRSCLMQHLPTKTIYIFWCGLEKVHFQTNMISTVLITKNVIFKSPNSLIHFEKSYSCYQHFLFFTIIFRISSNFSRSLSFSGQFYLSWTCQHWACLIPVKWKKLLHSLLQICYSRKLKYSAFLTKHFAINFREFFVSYSPRNRQKFSISLTYWNQWQTDFSLHLSFVLKYIRILKFYMNFCVSQFLQFGSNWK